MTQNPNRTGSDLPGALPATGFETVDLGAVGTTAPSSTSSSQFQTAGSGSSQAGAVVDQVQQTVGAAADQAKQTTGEVVDQAKQQATSLVAAQKDRAATSLGDVAQALRHTSEQLQGPEQEFIHQYVDKAADRVEHLSDYLRSRDVRDIVSEVEQYARRQPVLFLGGAFVLGLVGARFLKSTSQPTSTSGSYPPPSGYAPPRLPDYRSPSTGSFATTPTSYSTGSNRPGSTIYGSTSGSGTGSMGSSSNLGTTSSIGGTGNIGSMGSTTGGTSSMGITTGHTGSSTGSTGSIGSTGSMEDR